MCAAPLAPSRCTFPAVAAEVTPANVLGFARSPSAMPFSFGKSQKSPGEIVRNLKDHIAHMERLDAADKKCEKVGKRRACLTISSTRPLM